MKPEKINTVADLKLGDEVVFYNYCDPRFLQGTIEQITPASKNRSLLRIIVTGRYKDSPFDEPASVSPHETLELLPNSMQLSIDGMIKLQEKVREAK